MKCNNCMAIIPDDSEFCQKCGSKISSASANSGTSVEQDMTELVEALKNLNYNNESTFRHNFNIALEAGKRAASAAGSAAADKAISYCVNTFDQIAVVMYRDIYSLSKYSMLPGGSPRAKALKATNKYIFILDALVRIFEIPSASAATVNTAIKKVKAIAESQVLFQASLQYKIQNDWNYDFDRKLAENVQRYYPDANIKK